MERAVAVQVREAARHLARDEQRRRLLEAFVPVRPEGAVLAHERHLVSAHSDYGGAASVERQHEPELAACHKSRVERGEIWVRERRHREHLGAQSQ